MTEAFQRGFTLLEALLVLTLVGILASLAYPGYARHLRQGERQSIQHALQEQLLQQEQYRAQHPAYAEFTPGEPGDLPFRAETGHGSSRYMLGARPCKTDDGHDMVLADCVEAWAQPATPQSGRPSYARDSLGRSRCDDVDGAAPCPD